MKQPIKVPAVGESITEATISAWLKKDGEFANQGEPVLAIDTDKASVEVVADAAGTVKSMAKPGDVVKIGAVVGEIDTDGKASASAVSAPSHATPEKKSSNGVHLSSEVPTSPAVRRAAAETGADISKIAGTGPKGRVTKSDVMSSGGGGGSVETIVVPAKPVPVATTKAPKATLGRGSRRVPMTTIRKRIAERLLSAQQNMAILTTFNEVDLSAVNSLREKYKEQFKQKYGISLGFMGFFTKAAIEALKDFPQVNAFIDGTDIIFNDFYNVGVAVSTEKGLIVPVIKDADTMSLAEIELSIKEYGLKAREGKISLDDLSGGTFTISNGGVFGSLMSTPILNPPQSAILGMHSIQDRPVVVNGQIVIRPMMYLALSYDHRMIDGKEAVSFLVKIKEAINDPTRLLLEV